MSDYINNIRFDTKKAEAYFSQRLAYTLGPVELQHMIDDNKIKLIDVRSKEAYEEGHIPSAISVPKEELASRLDKLSKNDVHVVYCYNAQCHLAAAAALILSKNGYPAMELEGGFNVWRNDFQFDIES